MPVAAGRSKPAAAPRSSSRHLQLLLCNSDPDDGEADHSFICISCMVTPVSSAALDVVGNTVAVSLFAWQQSQAITRPAWHPQISISVCCRFKGPQRNRSLRGCLRCSAARTQECRSHVVEELHCDRTVGFGHTPPPGVVALPTKPSNEAWDRVGGAMRYGCVCIAQTTGASRVGTVACARPSGNAHAPAQDAGTTGRWKRAHPGSSFPVGKLLEKDETN